MFVQTTISYDKTCVFKTLKDKICLHTIFKTLTNISDTKDNFNKLYKLHLRTFKTPIFKCS